jgi:hypothetical protein
MMMKLAHTSPPQVGVLPLRLLPQHAKPVV